VVAAAAAAVVLVVAALVSFVRIGEKMTPKMGQTPLLQELSSLEVEPLEIVVNVPGREGFYTPSQDSRLDTLTSTSRETEVALILTGKGAFPTNSGGCCCCCCCPCCCCAL